MAEDWKTKIVELSGGVLENISPIVQGIQAEGSLISGINYEPAAEAGYRRISGYALYDSTALSGTGNVTGVFPFKDMIIGCRGTYIQKSTGAGWTTLTSTQTAGGRYLCERYSFGVPTTQKIILVDGVNWPIMYDGTTTTQLENVTYTNLPAALEGATSVSVYKRHVFYTAGQQVLFSAPSDETTHATASGGGTINMGQEVYALKVWRNFLYVFGPTSIFRISGNSSADFVVEEVTKNIGCVSPFTLQELNGDLLYLSQDGVRTIAGTERINDTSLETLTRSIDKRIDLLDLTNDLAVISSIIIRHKNQYRLYSSKFAQETASARGVLGGIRRSFNGQLQWEWFDLLGVKMTCADSFYTEDNEVAVFGGYDGYVYQLESGNSFNGGTVYHFLRIPYLVYDDPALRKILRKIKVYFLADNIIDLTLGYTFDYLDNSVIQPPTLNITADTDSFATYGGSSSLYGTTEYGGVGSFITSYNLVGSCLNSSFYIEGQDTNSPHTVQSLVIEYTLGGKR